MDKNIKTKQTIILSGGGTGGSVTPLLAVAEKLMTKNTNINYVFIGTKNGPEKEIVSKIDLPQRFKFISLPAGKLRRYFSIKNFLDVFVIIYAFFLSFIYLHKLKPKVIFSAGSFVSVPLVWAAWFMKIPVVIHQQDVLPGLANRLMAKTAKVIGVTFPQSAKIYGKKAKIIGNPIRRQMIDEAKKKKTKYLEQWKFKKKLPILLVIGGGTGSLALNNLIKKTWPRLKSHWQVVHISGHQQEFKQPIDPDYRHFSFLPNKDLIALMSIADLLLSRAGLGIITEMSALALPAIIVPMPNSHQENNAQILAENEAAWVIKQADLTVDKLTEKLNTFKNDKNIGKKFSLAVEKIMLKGAEDELANILNNYFKK